MLQKIGRDKPKNTVWPPDIETATDAVMSINEAYQRNHRNGKVGGYHAEQINPGHMKLTCNNPYPCQFDQGLIEGVVFKFATETALVNEVGVSVVKKAANSVRTKSTYTDIYSETP
jgi:hypothetical protein